MQKENYLALLGCGLSEKDPDEVFSLLDISPQMEARHRMLLARNNDEVAQEMINLKEEGYTNKKIGEIYGITANSVYRRIRSYKGRVKSAAAT